MGGRRIFLHWEVLRVRIVSSRIRRLSLICSEATVAFKRFDQRQYRVSFERVRDEGIKSRLVNCGSCLVFGFDLLSMGDGGERDGVRSLYYYERR